MSVKNASGFIPRGNYDAHIREDWKKVHGIWEGMGGPCPAFNGIVFPAVQVPSSGVNTLDDYEEGTWNPTRVGFTEVMGGGSITNAGYYTKIGRLVILTATIVCAGGATIAAVSVTSRLTGLPFTAAVGAPGIWSNHYSAAEGGHVVITGTTMYISTAWAAASQYWTMTAIIWI